MPYVKICIEKIYLIHVTGVRTSTCLPGGGIVCGPYADCVGRRRNICQCRDGYPAGNPYGARGCKLDENTQRLSNCDYAILAINSGVQSNLRRCQF